jgi:hypothetical protein
MQSMTGINSRTIKKYLRRMRERGNIENLPRRGGIRKTILRDDTILFRSVKTNRRQIRVITLSHHRKLCATIDLLSCEISGDNINQPLAVDLRNCDVPGHYSTYINRQNQSTTGKL